jgi:hypothetical protein
LPETSTFWEALLARKWWGSSDPIVDICHYCSSTSGTMDYDKILANPSNKVVLKHAFDNLVEQIRTN